MLYCIVARHVPQAAARALETLHQDDAVCVIDERRRCDRRRSERRAASARFVEEDRRRIHGFDGRRVMDRRAPLVDVGAPPSGSPHEGVRYAERVVPRQREFADAELARLVLRAQAGDGGAMEEVYRVMFPEVWAYFRVVLGEHAEAEDAAHQVFVSALTALSRFQLRNGGSARAWLFRIARHEGIDHLKRRGRQLVENPETIAERIETTGRVPAGGLTFASISGPELLTFIDRLPLSQRQVLALRYMLGMRTSEIAAMLDKTSQAIRHLESRALRCLQERLSAVGRRAPRAEADLLAR